MSEKPTAKVEDVLRANAVRDTWMKAVEWVAKKEAMATSLGASLLSKIVGPEIPLLTVNARHISCFGKDLEGNQVQEPCKNLRLSSDGKTHHCSACKCGDTFLSQLEPGLKLSKLLYPRLDCPLKKRGFSNEFEDADFDKKKRVVYWDAAHSGGLGDYIAVLWISMGYRDAGWKVKFLRTGDHGRPCYDELAVACGFEITDDRSEGAWRLGHVFPAYTDSELRVDQGKNNRLAVWSSWLPSSPIPRRPVLKVPDSSRKWAKEQLAFAKGRRVAVMAPGAHWKGRVWPLPYWYELKGLLEKQGFLVIGVGGKETEDQLVGFEKGLSNQSFLDTLELIRGVDLFVGNDSGPAWICSLTDTPGVIPMGSMSNLYTHVKTMREVYTKEMACVKCHCRLEKGYHLACDYGCQALFKLSYQEVFEECMSLMGSPCQTSTPSSPESPASTPPPRTSKLGPGEGYPLEQLSPATPASPKPV